MVIYSTMDSKIQIQVQVGDTRRVFFMDPRKTYPELEGAVYREVSKTRNMEFGLMYENDENPML